MLRLERCWKSSSCDWKKQQQSVQSGDSHLDHSHLWTHKMEKTSCIKEPVCVCVCAYTCLCAAGCVCACVQRWGFPRAANEGNTAFIECVALGRHPPGTDKHRRPRKDGTTMERTTWPERRRRCTGRRSLGFHSSIFYANSNILNYKGWTDAAETWRKCYINIVKRGFLPRRDVRIVLQLGEMLERQWWKHTCWIEKWRKKGLRNVFLTIHRNSVWTEI